jgi:hypothetical protein
MTIRFLLHHPYYITAAHKQVTTMSKHVLFLSLAFAFLRSTSALPLLTNSTPSNFLLVTTSSCEPSANSSLLPNVSATSLFDPFYQSNFLLRTIAPGYGSLPRFNLSSSGVLQTISTGPHGLDFFVINSTSVIEGEELQFVAENPAAGNLGLRDGYLLALGGDGNGWTLCDGGLGQSVVSFCHGVLYESEVLWLT